MPNEAPLILPLSEVRADLIDSVGGKAASLGEMLSAGINVPPGFVITTALYERSKTKLSTEDQATILAAFDELGAKRVAVRSSAVAEDSSSASWAGQLETVLNVERDGVIKAVEYCWASMQSTRAQAYAQENDIAKSQQAVAVVVQKMVDADRAGVIFTANPVTQTSTEAVIEAVYGLGELLVQGLVTPESYTLNNRTGEATHYSEHRQTRMLVYRNGQNQEVPLAKTGKILTTEQLKNLWQQGKEIEKHYGRPQDIEFAFSGDTLFIVQSRPITTLAREPIEVEQVLPVIIDLLEGWGFSAKDWILTGQYAYRLLGYDVSVRPGHHNIIVRRQQIPWKIPDDLLETYPVGDSRFTKQYQEFMDQTGHDFDLILLTDAAWDQKLELAQSYQLLDGRQVLINSVPGQLGNLEDLLRNSGAEGWGEEKGRRILGFVNELAIELKRNNKLEWAAAHSALAKQYAYLKKVTTVTNKPGEGQAADTLYYLGEPHDLFYWGPSRAKPLYMSDFMEAVQLFFEACQQDDSLPNPPKTLVLFYKDKMVWLSNAAAFSNFTREVFTIYQRQQRTDADITSWQLACEALDSAPDDEHLPKLLHTAWQATLFAEFALYGAESAIAKRFDRFDAKVRQQIWAAFTAPDKTTFLQQIDDELLKTNDPKAVAERYPWRQDGYSGVYSGIKDYFKKRLKVLEANEASSVAHKDLAELAKQYKLTKDELAALALTRKLAGFMDDRKAWMMRTRRLLYAARRTFPVAMEHGWLFDGASSKIGKTDTAELWVKYVDFKAADTVLTGLVASSGGHHFSNGEVFIAQTPHDAMPDKAVLVVPSTSPTYIPLMRRAGGLITDHGGMMSHAAIVAREFGLPCIVGTKRATKVLKNGDKVVLDLVKGEVNK